MNPLALLEENKFTLFTGQPFLAILPMLFTIWVPPVVWGLFAYSFIQQVFQMVYSFF